MTFLVIAIGNILYHRIIGSVTRIDNISVLVTEGVKCIKVEQYDLRENTQL